MYWGAVYQPRRPQVKLVPYVVKWLFVCQCAASTVHTTTNPQDVVEWATKRNPKCHGTAMGRHYSTPSLTPLVLLLLLHHHHCYLRLIWFIPPTRSKNICLLYMYWDTHAWNREHLGCVRDYKCDLGHLLHWCDLQGTLLWPAAIATYMPDSKNPCEMIRCRWTAYSGNSKQ